MSVQTTTTLTSSLNPSVYSAPVTFTSRTVPSGGGNVPSGTLVTFYNSGVASGTGLTAASGYATLTIATLPAGSGSITATYAGSGTYLTSTSAILTQVVTLEPTTTALTSSLNPSTYGNMVTLTATVSPAVPDHEYVTFYNGATSLGNGALSSSVTSIGTTGLPTGTLSLTAVYAGDTNYATSTSNTVSQVVNKIVTTSAVTSSNNPSPSGSSVTFTATVSPTPPDGDEVAFTLTEGTVLLGTPTTVGGVASVTSSALPAGTDHIVASYVGSADYASSLAGLVQVVGSTSESETETGITLGTSSIPITSVTGSWVVGNITYTNKPSYGAVANTAIPSGQITPNVLVDVSAIPIASIPSGITSVSGGYNIGGDVYYTKSKPKATPTLPAGDIVPYATTDTHATYGADTDHLPDAQEGMNVYPDTGFSPLEQK